MTRIDHVFLGLQPHAPRDQLHRLINACIAAEDDQDIRAVAVERAAHDDRDEGVTISEQVDSQNDTDVQIIAAKSVLE